MFVSYFLAWKPNQFYYLLFTFVLLYFFTLPDYDVADALLDVHASRENHDLFEEDELLTVRW